MTRKIQNRQPSQQPSQESISSTIPTIEQDTIDVESPTPEQDKQPGSSALGLTLSDIDPGSKTDPNQCPYCKQVFKRIGRHLNACKQNPNKGQPSQDAAPTLDLVPEEIFINLFDITGKVLGARFGKKWEFNQAESVGLARAWKPVADYYFPMLNQYGPLPIAILTTIMIVGVKFVPTEAEIAESTPKQPSSEESQKAA